MTSAYRAMPSSSPTADMARAITRSASKQTFYTIRWLVDRDLIDDAYRAYAYCRWVDDTIDASLNDRRSRMAFVARQKTLLLGLDNGDSPEGLTPEEQMLVDLVRGQRDRHPGLRSYLSNMMAVMEFDAWRRGSLITVEQLDRYSGLLATAVMGALGYFIGHHHAYPASESRTLAVRAAHISHMLRDTVKDLQAGFINIPREVLEAHHLAPTDIAHPAYRDWVRQRVDLAWACFREGKRYSHATGHARLQLAAYLYCARFEGILRQIELDHFFLRSEYVGLRPFPNWLLGLVQPHRPTMCASKRTPTGGAR